MIEGTCCAIAPSGFMKDRQIINSLAVLPVVFVDFIDVGSSITVSVSFEANMDSTEQTINTVDLGCNTSGTSLTELYSASTENIVHVVNNGVHSNVTLNMCTVNPTSTADMSRAYFYDE